MLCGVVGARGEVGRWFHGGAETLARRSGVVAALLGLGVAARLDGKGAGARGGLKGKDRGSRCAGLRGNPGDLAGLPLRGEGSGMRGMTGGVSLSAGRCARRATEAGLGCEASWAEREAERAQLGFSAGASARVGPRLLGPRGEVGPPWAGLGKKGRGK